MNIPLRRRKELALKAYDRAIEAIEYETINVAWLFDFVQDPAEFPREAGYVLKILKQIRRLIESEKALIEYDEIKPLRFEHGEKERKNETTESSS